MKAAGKSARTVNQHRNTAVAFCEWCVNVEGRMPKNPLKNLPMLDERQDRRRVARPPTEGELAKLLAVAGSRRTFYLTTAHTGLRRSELEQVTWGDFDLD